MKPNEMEDAMPSETLTKPTLILHSTAPLNAETPRDKLRAAFITDEDDFYIRSHGDIPQLDARTHRIIVDGRVERHLALSLDALQRDFPQKTLTAVMQCAGNRRADLDRLKPVSGDKWEPGAIGNAEWTGVALADVLRAAGAKIADDHHVAFTCCDRIEMEGEGRFFYGVSIPMEKAMAPEVLLAFAMNGRPLAPEHGFPVRVVVPGFAGVRSPKWLARITVQNRPSDNHMQQRDYKLLPPETTPETVDWSAGVTINAMPLNAAICEPAPNATLSAGPIEVRGYAIATARDVTRVDVSMDGGKSWVQAELGEAAPWSWTFWSTTFDLPRGEHEIVARAWDSAGQTQPATADETWNFKGYLSAAWHRVRVQVV